MRNGKKLLAFKYTQDMSVELTRIVNELALSEDGLWEAWVWDLEDMIDEKVLEIDMLLSKIKHAVDYTHWVIVDADEEIKKTANIMKNKMDKIKKVSPIAI